MKNLSNTIVLGMLVLALLACREENLGLNITSEKWEVQSFQQVDSLSKEPLKTYVLEFTEDSYRMKLDANTCGGIYEIADEGQITFYSGYCTYVCCDSELAIQLFVLLRGMKNYSIQANKLTLRGEGFIELVRQ